MVLAGGDLMVLSHIKVVRILGLAVVAGLVCSGTGQQNALAESLRHPDAKSFTWFETSHCTVRTGVEFDTRTTEQLARIIETNTDALSRIFRITLDERFPVYLFTPKRFEAMTGLREQAQALYQNKTILLTVNSPQAPDIPRFTKSVRHELTHLFIDRISGGRSPAWFDEGVAQLLEGSDLSLRENHLREWVQMMQQPLQWHELKENIHLKDPALVPVAYAQSLFAVRTLLNSKGFPALVSYLSELSTEVAAETAFERAFGISQERFENQTEQQIIKWAAVPVAQPFILASKSVGEKWVYRQ